MENEKKVVAYYSITRYNDGTTSVDNIKTDNVQPLTTEQMFDDICRVAKNIEKQREMEMVRGSVFAAFNEWFQAVQNQERAEEADMGEPEAAAPKMTEKSE